jgi:outer membrane protein OmpA-like peptidoglycan-associated protein
MSRLSLKIAVGAVAVAVLVPATSAVAQTPGYVRVVDGSARIQRWYRLPQPGILLEVSAGTTLEVLDREEDWFWVIVPPDVHGTRRAGWIRARYVEPVTAHALSVSAGDHGHEPVTLGSVSPPSVPTTATIAEDRVILTARPDETTSTPTDATVPTREYKFEDVRFDRNRYSLRQQDLDVLRAVVVALKADPSLVVSIEGHTCSLGTTTYNRGLGMRRANAVKNHLVSEGVGADRLNVVSLGEQHAQYDNSVEKTRQLNRRVALVSVTQP